jgi:hypothetical protein
VNLETINAVAQWVVAIEVGVSLFYLAAQIHQNTRSIRAMMVDSLAHPIADVIRPMAEDWELLMRAFHVVVENWHGATEADRLRALPLAFLHSSCSRTPGPSNGRARSTRNGKVGTLTFGCIIIAPV